jgi:AmmeMemoRadiSam system protein A
MYQPQSIYTKIALQSIVNRLSRTSESLHQDEIPSEVLEQRRGCFVSLHKTDGSLRGCIGTIEAQEENLFKEIERNAISAAFNDSRFSSLTFDELEEIELSVDVLTEPEQIFDLDDLDPLIYGVIVSDESFSRAVLLPSIPTIDTVEKQIDIVKRKAGLSKRDNADLKFYRFTSNRYH